MKNYYDFNQSWHEIGAVGAKNAAEAAQRPRM
jgi:hypothetical protein